MLKKPQRTPEQQEYRDNLAHNIKSFRQYGDTGKELSETLYNGEKNSIQYIEALGVDRILKKDIAYSLIDQGEYEYLAKHLQRFSGLDIRIASILIRKHYGKFVAKDINRFIKEDTCDIANILINNKETELVLDNFKKFEGVNYMNIVNALIVDENKPELLAKKIKKIDKKYHKNIAMQLIEHGFGGELLHYIDKFDEGCHEEVANTLINSGHCREVVMDIMLSKRNKLKKLGTSTAKLLIKNGRESCVIEHPEKFGLKK